MSLHWSTLGACHALLLSALLWQILQVQSLVKFTNLQCFSMDENFSVFPLCRLQAVKRDVAELNIRAKIVQMPNQTIAMRWQLLKRASGYKPFLYDITVPDICEYLDKRNHPFVNIMLNSFSNRSTLSKCPLPSELSLEHFRFPVKALELLPLPSGEYAIFASTSFANCERNLLKVFFTLTEFR